MCQLSTDEAFRLLVAQQHDPQYPALVGHVASGPVVAMELMAASGIRKWLDILGKLHQLCMAGAAQQACKIPAPVI